MIKHPLLICLFMYLIASFTQSCVPAVVAAGGVAGSSYIAAQERGVKNAVDDTTIWGGVKKQFLDHNAKEFFTGVNVEVIEGRVHLLGVVDSSETKMQATRLAWQVEGVKEVINEIQLRDKSENRLQALAQDNWIGAQLRSKMLFAKDIQSRNYSIEVIYGVVYLMGLAVDQDELNRVTHTAGTINGVKKVVSYVRLRNQS